MASNIVSLPRFIVLKHQRNDKYLIHIRDSKNRLEFSGREVESLHAKYEVVPSTSEGDHELVHIKCCFNNKYWVCHPGQYYVTADAIEKEEDQSKPSCTLFKPVFFTSNRIGLYNVHRKLNVMFNDERPFHLVVGIPLYQAEYLDFWDWGSLPILPKFIALKGDNGLYLNAYTEDSHLKVSWITAAAVIWPYSLFSETVRKKIMEPGHVYLRFNSKDKAEQTVGNQVFTNPDGTIRIKNIHTSGFWKRSPNWIWPYSQDETNNDPDTLFKVTKLAHNKIALQNLGNNNYCERLSVDGNHDCLNANTTTIPNTAQFEVEELVSSRQIYNVRFREEDARVYKKEILHKVKSTDNNHTSVTQEGSIEFEYTLEESQEWTTSSTVKLSIETEITFGSPEVAEGKVKLGAEVTKEVHEGKTLSVSVKKTYSRKVSVPPRSKVIADFIVTQAICDIPYSYSQRETLTSGATLTNDKDDGLYTCVQTNVEFDAKEVPI